MVLLRMRLQHTQILSLVLATSSVTSQTVPPNHEFLLDNFGGHFRCPFSDKWLKMGPLNSAKQLGLIPDESSVVGVNGNRDLQIDNGDDIVAGSCAYTSPWSGPSCFEMRGSSWTEESMTSRCDRDDTKGTLSISSGCDTPATIGGWCMIQQDGNIEASVLALGGPMTCATLKSACTGFARGNFVAAVGSECEESETSTSAPPESTIDNEVELPPSLSMDAGLCTIAPGPIGAAHQNGFSGGYSRGCPGTPAEGSPYMWPLRWAADVQTQAMVFGNDTIVYESQGRTYYLLNKNFKRGDIYSQKGKLRTIGQAPCTSDDCENRGDTRTTVLHRNSQMYFIDWKEGTANDDDGVSNIKSCSWMDLQIVGNIRPDWFMDNRGDATDVQYLGDQHIYYLGKPRLAKQWRKKDFANQYFTMSMQANLEEDGVHWPLVLNIPGEGFGDDMLQHYSNHKLLTDDDEHLFRLDEAYMAAGGSCPQLMSEGADGPPTHLEHIPSNLEVDTNAWVTKEYTFSPIWKPPEVVNGMNIATNNNNSVGVAVTQAGPSTLVESCFDVKTNSVQLSVTYETDSDSWLGLTFRKNEDCLMTPRSGEPAEFILISDDEASHGELPSNAKSFASQGASDIQNSLVPLSDVDGFSDVDVTSDGSSVTLSFQKKVEDNSAPDIMYLNYAMGSTFELGYHASRGCFEVTSFPSCPNQEAVSDESSGFSHHISLVTMAFFSISMGLANLL